MVGYILGDSAAKRKVFGSRTGFDEIYVDNSEVIATVKGGDGWYYAVGEIPFADMSVESYVAYSRALFDAQNMSRKRICSLLKKTGFSKKSRIRMKKLDTFDFRKVQIASKLREDSKTVYINLDGVEYSKRNLRRVQRLIKSLKGLDVFLIVSDVAFVRYPSKVLFVDEDSNVSSFPFDGLSSSVRVRKNPMLKGALARGAKVRRAVKSAYSLEKAK
jgi:hypothetical protein